MDFSILRGPGGSGKSSTIRIVYDSLTAIPFTPIEQFGRAWAEIEHVIKVQELTIGIIGAGDTPHHINERFRWLTRFNCDYVICACRPSQLNINRMTVFIDQYFGRNVNIHWVEKVGAANVTLRDAENRASARELLNAIGLINRLGLII